MPHTPLIVVGFSSTLLRGGGTTLPRIAEARASGLHTSWSDTRGTGTSNSLTIYGPEYAAFRLINRATHLAPGEP